MCCSQNPTRLKRRHVFKYNIQPSLHLFEMTRVMVCYAITPKHNVISFCISRLSSNLQEANTTPEGEALTPALVTSECHIIVVVLVHLGEMFL